MFRDTWRVRIERFARQSASGTAAALLALAIVLLFEAFGWLEVSELKLYDAVLRWRARTSFASRVRIVYVELDKLKDDEKDLEHIKPSALAAYLAPILGEKPTVVGLDILLGQNDTQLEQLVRGKRVVVVESPKYAGESPLQTLCRAGKTYQLTPPVGIPADLIGYADYSIDPDCVIRRASMYQQSTLIPDKGPAYRSSFPYLVTAFELRRLSPEHIYKPDGDDYRIGPARTRLSRLGSNAGGYRNLNNQAFEFLIDFRDRADSFLSCSLTAPDDCGRLGGSDPMVVLVGYRSEDNQRTPVGVISGVELHARVVSQLIRMGQGQSSQTVAVGFKWGSAWILLAALLASTYGTLARSSMRFGWGLLLNLAAIFAAGALLLAYASLWMPSAAAIVAACLAAPLARVLAARWYRIFISYASEDRETVARIYACLRAAGHSPWVDRERLQGGDEYPEELGAAIRDSDRFLACISPHSVVKAANADGVLAKELRQAFDAWDKRNRSSRYVVPVLLEPCEIPTEFQRQHCVRFFEGDGPQALRRALSWR